jgi:protein SCO1/2
MSTNFFTKLIRLTLFCFALGALISCDKLSPNSSKASFHSIDITGANYAQDFSLPDQFGQIRTLQDFKGKVVVVFFGFTQCPDVCPTTMAELAAIKQSLGTQGDTLQGIFITVDPERDTPELLTAYMKNFDPSFLALRPEPEQLPTLAQSFKIYYRKVPGKTPSSYTMDHSAGSYIYDTKGNIRLFTRYGSGAEKIRHDIQNLLQTSN